MRIFRNIELYMWFYLGALVFAGLGLLALFCLKPELTVTNKRVYGKIGALKKVDLPINQISAVGTGVLNSISISTSSGAIRFWGVSNRDDIANAISKLLAERQEPSVEKNSAASNSTPDELKKYKELLDSGIITQEEFDTKKKQLLGL